MAGMPWGGSESLWSRAAHQLMREGHQVTVNYRWWPTEPAGLKKLREAGATIWLRDEPGRFNWTRWIFNRVRNATGNPHLESNNRIKEWLHQEKPDFVLVTLGYQADRIAPAKECIRQGIPFGINVQCASVTTFIHENELGDFREAYAKAAKVFFVSPENQHKVETNLAIKLKNADIIDNPFNVSFNAQPAWPTQQLPYSLACVGRFHFASKGQDLLIDVLQQDKWRDRELQIVLYGESHGNLQQLQDLISLYRLTSRIRLAGYQENVESIWTEHHGLILPSRYEGAPLVVVEAMLCNRICIATNLGRNRELIDDNQTGFIAAAATTELLDDAMERAWEKRDLWREMGAEAGKRIRQRYNPDPVGSMHDQLMQVVKSSSTNVAVS
jgi:glycosyltransferase involved in cell wall biosynthesis